MATEIVDFPIKNGGSFHCNVSSPEGTNTVFFPLSCHRTPGGAELDGKYGHLQALRRHRRETGIGWPQGPVGCCFFCCVRLWALNGFEDLWTGFSVDSMLILWWSCRTGTENIWKLCVNWETPLCTQSTRWFLAGFGASLPGKQWRTCRSACLYLHIYTYVSYIVIVRFMTNCGHVYTYIYNIYCIYASELLRCKKNSDLRFMIKITVFWIEPKKRLKCLKIMF